MVNRFNEKRQKTRKGLRSSHWYTPRSCWVSLFAKERTHMAYSEGRPASLPIPAGLHSCVWWHCGHLERLSCGHSKASGTSVKERPASAEDERDSGSVLGWRRSPAAGNRSPLQYFRLESPLDRESLAGYSPWGHRVRHLSTNTELS